MELFCFCDEEVVTKRRCVVRRGISYVVAMLDACENLFRAGFTFLYFYQNVQAVVESNFALLDQQQNIRDASTRKASCAFPRSVAQPSEGGRHPARGWQADVYPSTTALCAVPLLDDARPHFTASAATHCNERTATTTTTTPTVRVQTRAGAVVQRGPGEAARAETVTARRVHVREAREDV